MLFRSLQRFVVGGEIRDRAVLVALGDVRAGQAELSGLGPLAVAPHDTAHAPIVDGFPAGIVAEVAGHGWQQARSGRTAVYQRPEVRDGSVSSSARRRKSNSARVITPLLAAPQTLLHGDFYPANVLVRDGDGLAMSSRNARLSPAARRAASAIPQALAAVKSLHAAGERRADLLKDAAIRTIGSEPSLTLDYIDLADDVTLLPLGTSAHLSDATSGRVLVSIAASIEGVRLIDAITLRG